MGERRTSIRSFGQILSVCSTRDALKGDCLADRYVLPARDFKLTFESPKNEQLSLFRHGALAFEHLILTPPKSKGRYSGTLVVVQSLTRPYQATVLRSHRKSSSTSRTQAETYFWGFLPSLAHPLRSPHYSSNSTLYYLQIGRLW